MRYLSRKMIVAPVVGLVGIVLLLNSGGSRAIQAQPAGAADKPIEEHWKSKGYTYQEASSCKTCHTLPTGDTIGSPPFEVSLLTEYAIWKVHDKHAQAYAVLEGARGKKIASLLKTD